MSPSDDLFGLFDPDPELAEQKFKMFRRRLMFFLDRRRCPCSEDALQETLIRVLEKLRQGSKVYIDPPDGFFFGVARNVLHEFVRKSNQEQPLGPDQIPSHEPRWLERLCASRCLNTLTADQRELLEEYYLERGKGHRKRLAAARGKKPTALVSEVFRIKKRLQRCLDKCLGLDNSRKMHPGIRSLKRKEPRDRAKKED